MKKNWDDINSLRIARPVTDLNKSIRMYCNGLVLDVIASFEDHHGFGGAILGKDGLPYHFEMTFCKTHPITPSPTKEDFLVLYVPNFDKWHDRCNLLLEFGFIIVNPFNPYWDKVGKTFQDHDGYRIVLQNSKWIF